MKRIVAVVVLLTAMAVSNGTAQAGRNAGAALIVHTTAVGKTVNCSSLRTAIASCDEANPTSSAGEGQSFIVAVYATSQCHT